MKLHTIWNLIKFQLLRFHASTWAASYKIYDLKNVRIVRIWNVKVNLSGIWCERLAEFFNMNEKFSCALNILFCCFSDIQGINFWKNHGSGHYNVEEFNAFVGRGWKRSMANTKFNWIIIINTTAREIFSFFDST